MKLFSSPTTPFGRKILLAASIKGIADKIQVTHVDTNPPGNAELLQHNPLGKIPALVLEDGTVLFDSRVICEYVDTLGESGAPRLIPASGPARWRTLTRAVLADGIADAGILIFYESRFRPNELHSTVWLERQQAKVDAGLDHFEKNPPAWNGSPAYEHICLASALGHLEFRHAGRWRKDRPRLVNWLDQFDNAVPAYAATTPVA